MAAPTIYQDVAQDVDIEGVGQLFSGLKFWVAQRVPSRNRLLDDIKANGGEIVMLEKMADYRIADHLFKHCPPGSISYEFVDKSIQQGELRDPEDHRCGPPLGEAREPGSITRVAKGGRTPYTAEDDSILYKWVRDAEAAGSLAKGNEIYKQLEAKVGVSYGSLRVSTTKSIQYPRHPWQSWRDRYIKQLQNRPPSAFNIPHNPPPSPPSDHVAERVPPVALSAKEAQPTAPKSEQTNAPDIAGSSKTSIKEEFTLDELTGLFSSDDWEKLYAFADVIDGLSGDERYNAAWAEWAEFQEHQTAEQWRQYYEKVVRPQWLRDPTWKREQIKQKIEAKQDASSSSHSQIFSQQHEALEEQNEANAASATVQDTIVCHESPGYERDLQERAAKRLRGDDIPDDEHEGAESSQPVKRQRRMSTPSTIDLSWVSPVKPKPDKRTIAKAIVVTMTGLIEELSKPEVQRALLRSYEDEADDATESIESDHFTDLSRLPSPSEEHDEASLSELPSNTPTPRAARQKASNYDTQAILSSPTPDIISKPPRPIGFTHVQSRANPQASSSPPRHPESDASTTQSLQEFRRSLNDEDVAKISYAQIPPLLRPTSGSTAPSSSHSSSSDDPDPPLEVEEIDEFFNEQYAEGFSNEFIVRALKRTRMRPSLAVLVLDAWKEGKPLPNQRGIWSIEDDEAVEGGDGVALARLERKHTVDGWGGITERLIFLEAQRNR